MIGISIEDKYLIKSLQVLVDWKRWSKNDNTGAVRAVRGRRQWRF